MFFFSGKYLNVYDTITQIESYMVFDNNKMMFAPKIY